MFLKMINAYVDRAQERPQGSAPVLYRYCILTFLSRLATLPEKRVGVSPETHLTHQTALFSIPVDAPLNYFGAKILFLQLDSRRTGKSPRGHARLRGGLR